MTTNPHPTKTHPKQRLTAGFQTTEISSLRLILGTRKFNLRVRRRHILRRLWRFRRGSVARGCCIFCRRIPVISQNRPPPHSNPSNVITLHRCSCSRKNRRSRKTACQITSVAIWTSNCDRFYYFSKQFFVFFSNHLNTSLLCFPGTIAHITIVI